MAEIEDRSGWVVPISLLVAGALALGIPSALGYGGPFLTWHIAAISAYAGFWIVMSLSWNTIEINKKTGKEQEEREGFWAMLGIGAVVLAVNSGLTADPDIGFNWWIVAFVVVAVGSFLRAFRSQIEIRWEGGVNIGQIVNVGGGIISIVLIVLPFLL